MPTKIDFLGAVKGLLSIEKVFGIKIENLEKYLDPDCQTPLLNANDSDVIRCIEKEISTSDREVEDSVQNLCRQSINNDSNSNSTFKCYVKNINLFHFKIEELWTKENTRIGIYFVHDFLNDRELSQFEVFKSDVSFNHMSKFYETEDFEENDVGSVKCRLVGLSSSSRIVEFFDSDFDRVVENLHFEREGKIAFLPRSPDVLVKSELRFRE